jgi:hypothetical protein
MTKRNCIKPGPKRIAVSTGTYDKRAYDNKNIMPNFKVLKEHKHKEK